MKISIKLMAFICLLFLSFSSNAQSDSLDRQNRNWEEKTFLNLENISHGGYGALSLKVGKIKNSTTLFIGGKGGWIANHKLAIGMGGYGIISETQNLPDQGNQFFYSGGYGGFLIEPILFSEKLVHLSVPILFGGGWVGQIEKDDDGSKFKENDLTFLVVEPGLEIDFNITYGFRIALGCYYTIAQDIGNSSELNSDIMNNLSLGLQLKWGLF